MKYFAYFISTVLVWYGRSRKVKKPRVFFRCIKVNLFDLLTYVTLYANAMRFSLYWTPRQAYCTVASGRDCQFTLDIVRCWRFYQNIKIHVVLCSYNRTLFTNNSTARQACWLYIRIPTKYVNKEDGTRGSSLIRLNI